MLVAYLDGMPRPLRPIDEELIYHVINRGNNRQDVFHTEADFKAFLKALGVATRPAGWTARSGSHSMCSATAC